MANFNAHLAAFLSGGEKGVEQKTLPFFIPLPDISPAFLNILFPLKPFLRPRFDIKSRGLDTVKNSDRRAELLPKDKAMGASASKPPTAIHPQPEAGAPASGWDILAFSRKIS